MRQKRPSIAVHDVLLKMKNFLKRDRILNCRIYFYIRERQLDSMRPLGNVIDIESNHILFYDIAVMMSLCLLCGQISIYSRNSEYKSSCRKQGVEKQHSFFSFTFSLVGAIFHTWRILLLY